LIPLISSVNSHVRDFLNRINFPMVPVFLGTLFVINYLLSKLIEATSAPSLGHSITEIKEANFGLLFFLTSMWLYMKNKRSTSQNNSM
jgi:preprotein translocase subunit SecG